MQRSDSAWAEFFPSVDLIRFATLQWNVHIHPSRPDAEATLINQKDHYRNTNRYLHFQLCIYDELENITAKQNGWKTALRQMVLHRNMLSLA